MKLDKYVNYHNFKIHQDATLTTLSICLFIANHRMANPTVLFPPAAYTKLQALYMRKKRKKKRLEGIRNKHSFCIPVNVFFSNEKIQDLNKDPKLKVPNTLLGITITRHLCGRLVREAALVPLKDRGQVFLSFGECNITSCCACTALTTRHSQLNILYHLQYSVCSGEICFEGHFESWWSG